MSPRSLDIVPDPRFPGRPERLLFLGKPVAKTDGACKKCRGPVVVVDREPQDDVAAPTEPATPISIEALLISGVGTTQFRPAAPGNVAGRFECDACRSSAQLGAGPHVQLHRGLLASRVLAVAEEASAPAAGLMANLGAAGLLECVRDAAPGDFVPIGVFASSPSAPAMGELLRRLQDDPRAEVSERARFGPGAVHFDLNSPRTDPRQGAAVWPFLDSHATGDAGLFGPAAEGDDEVAEVLPPLASEAALNARAIRFGAGTIRSRWPGGVEILSLLRPGKPAWTLIYQTGRRPAW